MKADEQFVKLGFSKIQDNESTVVYTTGQYAVDGDIINEEKIVEFNKLKKTVEAKLYLVGTVLIHPLSIDLKLMSAIQARMKELGWLEGDVDVSEDRTPEIKINVEGGYLTATPSGDENYPGIVVEYVGDNDSEQNLSRPTALLEKPKGEDVRLLVWADSHQEDYSANIMFNENPDK